MKSLRSTVLLGLLLTGLLGAQTTAPVDAAKRNDDFSPSDTKQSPEVKTPAAQKRTEKKAPATATVAKPTAPQADRRAPVATTAKPQTVQAPSTRALTFPFRTQSPSSLTDGATVLRPQDSPVRSKQGTKFQAAINDARTASDQRAKDYQKDAKLEKVNEFVPTANAPAGTVRAGSEEKN
ncbi:MAG: hypothetical protein HZA31_08230 [Opitutae bacterium]|nr:hypothetical protein [Opitutae bacterium]